VKLLISDIAVINRQRRLIDKKKIEELANSIKANGLLHPIVVRKPFESELGQVDKASFVLCVGGRRLAAHLLLRLTEIEVNFKENLNALDAEIVELEENVVRENLRWDEEAAARARIHVLRSKQNPTQTLESTAEETGVTKSQLSRDVNLAEAIKKDPSLKGATSKGSAIRMLKHKKHMQERSETALKVQGSDIAKKLHTADGVEFIKALPDKSVDLVFSDLPYRIDYFEGARSGENMKGQYDDSALATEKFITEVVPEMVRVVKPTGWIVLFMSYEWHGWLQEIFKYTCLKHGRWTMNKEQECAVGLRIGDLGGCSTLKPELPPWIWTRRGKGNHGHYPELHASNRYEMIVVVNGGSAHLTKKPVENVLDFEPFSGERLHAMQKPHDLCCEIIDRTTVPGELVLDVCMGSGAGLAAAAAKGRDFLGCDLNPENLPAALSLVGQYYHRGAK
jgi:ParB/RepB/Spo0J family partition protein